MDRRWIGRGEGSRRSEESLLTDPGKFLKEKLRNCLTPSRACRGCGAPFEVAATGGNLPSYCPRCSSMPDPLRSRPCRDCRRDFTPTRPRHQRCEPCRAGGTGRFYRGRNHRLVPAGMKWCSGCRRELPLSSFGPGGVPYRRCLKCKATDCRRWRARHRADTRAAKRAAYRVSYVGKPLRFGQCEACGTEFSTVQPRKRFCTKGCGRRWAQIGRERPNKFTRQKVLVRDDWRCYLCGGDIDKTLVWPHPGSGSVDHIVPVSAGGSDKAENLHATHWGCNDEKGDRLPTWWERRAAGQVA